MVGDVFLSYTAEFVQDKERRRGAGRERYNRHTLSTYRTHVTMTRRHQGQLKAERGERDNRQGGRETSRTLGHKGGNTLIHHISVALW